MLIGISGKIGSGKDTVGKIIQYLTYDKQMLGSRNYFYPTDVFLEELKNNPRLFENETAPFQIKKYADKLKDFVCMLIGCTREQLEDQDFKNKELPEEWWYFQGRNGSLISYNKDSKRSDEDLIKTTPRLLLQIIGTECIRDKVHPNAWVNALFADYKYEIHRSEVPTRAAGFIDQHVYPNWIITDMRFPNELEAVKSRGGITIRVNRPYDSLNQDSLFSLQKQQETNNHPSETSLDSATFDFVISNDKDIEHLINEVRKILEKLNII